MKSEGAPESEGGKHHKFKADTGECCLSLATKRTSLLLKPGDQPGLQFDFKWILLGGRREEKRGRRKEGGGRREEGEEGEERRREEEERGGGGREQRGGREKRGGKLALLGGLPFVTTWLLIGWWVG